jgi:hypothetical protein
MEPGPRKVHQHQLVTALNLHRTTFEVQQMLALLQSKLEEAKDRLVSCDQTEFHKLQGEAGAYETLIRAITRSKPQIATAREE